MSFPWNKKKHQPGFNDVVIETLDELDLHPDIQAGPAVLETFKNALYQKASGMQPDFKKAKEKLRDQGAKFRKGTFWD